MSNVIMRQSTLYEMRRNYIHFDEHKNIYHKVLITEQEIYNCLKIPTHTLFSGGRPRPQYYEYSACPCKQGSEDIIVIAI